MNTKTPKAKKKMRLNIIDFLIIITLIGVAVGIAFRYDMVSEVGSRSRTDTFDVILLIQNIQTKKVQKVKILKSN